MSNHLKAPIDTQLEIQTKGAGRKATVG